MEWDASNRLNEGYKLLDGMKKRIKNKEIRMKVKRELYERMLAPIVKYRSELRRINVTGRKKVNVFRDGMPEKYGMCGQKNGYKLSDKKSDEC